MYKLIFVFILAFSMNLLGELYQSPTVKELSVLTVEKLKYNLKAKGATLEYRDLFDKQIDKENLGFMGYHGDSLDFLVFQDTLRFVMEEIVGIPIRKDFHYVGVPSTKTPLPLSLDDLVPYFVKDGWKESEIAKRTFPLNFTLYANSNQSGLNSLVNFTRNEGIPRVKLIKQLKEFFEELGMDPKAVEGIYEIAKSHLTSDAGVLLQFFDTSPSPYSFLNSIGYASYPTGFIFENRLTSEYFMEQEEASFPYELRILLTSQGIMNPKSPIVIKRITKIQPNKLKAWEEALKVYLRSLHFDSTKRLEFIGNLK